MNPDIKQQIDTYMNQKVTELLDSRQDKKDFTQQYGVPVTPYHVHNGVDSPLLTQIAGFQYGPFSQDATPHADDIAILAQGGGTTAANGGNIHVYAGNGGTLGGQGGVANLRGGSTFFGNVDGGDTQVKGGNGNGSGNGGDAFILSGDGGATGLGGVVELLQGAGQNRATGSLLLIGNSGQMDLQASSGSGSNAVGAAINITSGSGNGSGAAGNITLNAGTSGSGTVGETVIQRNSVNVYKSGLDTFSYAGPTSIDVTLNSVHKTTTVNATGSVTFNASSAGQAGQQIVIIIKNDATSGKTITFGSNFLSTGTLTGTTSKTAVIGFVSDGASFYEQYRTLAL